MIKLCIYLFNILSLSSLLFYFISSLFHPKFQVGIFLMHIYKLILFVSNELKRERQLQPQIRLYLYIYIDIDTSLHSIYMCVYLWSQPMHATFFWFLKGCIHNSYKTLCILYINVQRFRILLFDVIFLYLYIIYHLTSNLS